MSLPLHSCDASDRSCFDQTSGLQNTTAVVSTPASFQASASDLDPVSDATIKLVENVVNGGILPVLVLFGVTGNVINMAVFVRQGLGDRINLCLFSLALSDAGFNVSHLLSRIYTFFYLFDHALGNFWKVGVFSLAAEENRIGLVL
ncbi:hypothetical protein BaRGS_00013351 [Batillaria attramentaria]|uniref:G-protein coupled receptors family 1 profile domain-containing protein n=1 Tax=Batillaria attramentaria TaxID=370345 RepID=A0ABD0L7T0_9CAEN